MGAVNVGEITTVRNIFFSFFFFFWIPRCTEAARMVSGFNNGRVYLIGRTLIRSSSLRKKRSKSSMWTQSITDFVRSVLQTSRFRMISPGLKNVYANLSK